MIDVYFCGDVGEVVIIEVVVDDVLVGCVVLWVVVFVEVY